MIAHFLSLNLFKIICVSIVIISVTYIAAITCKKGNYQININLECLDIVK